MKGEQNWIHATFSACVWLLEETARLVDPYVPGGMDYIKINVILFCIILPVLLATSLGLNIYLIFFQ